jgi:hypothetical protein
MRRDGKGRKLVDVRAVASRKRLATRLVSLATALQKARKALLVSLSFCGALPGCDVRSPADCVARSSLQAI